MNNETTRKLRSFGLSMSSEYGAPKRDNFPDSDPWTCKIRRTAGDQRRVLTVPFYMGYGHGGAEPELADVIHALISDAYSYENARDFGDFARDLGYDEDSRTAERIYKECGVIARKLRRFLGDDFDTVETIVEDY